MLSCRPAHHTLVLNMQCAYFMDDQSGNARYLSTGFYKK